MSSTSTRYVINNIFRITNFHLFVLMFRLKTHVQSTVHARWRDYELFAWMATYFSGASFCACIFEKKSYRGKEVQFRRGLFNQDGGGGNLLSALYFIGVGLKTARHRKQSNYSNLNLSIWRFDLTTGQYYHWRLCLPVLNVPSVNLSISSLNRIPNLRCFPAFVSDTRVSTMPLLVMKLLLFSSARCQLLCTR